MDADREQKFDEATQACIEAYEASYQATKKCFELELQNGSMTEKKYKSYTARLDSIRIQLLELKGEIPARKEKSKYNAFGQRIGNIKKKD